MKIILPALVAGIAAVLALPTNPGVLQPAPDCVVPSSLGLDPDAMATNGRCGRESAAQTPLLVDNPVTRARQSDAHTTVRADNPVPRAPGLDTRHGDSTVAVGREGRSMLPHELVECVVPTVTDWQTHAPGETPHLARAYRHCTLNPVVVVVVLGTGAARSSVVARDLVPTGPASSTAARTWSADNMATTHLTTRTEESSPSDPTDDWSTLFGPPSASSPGTDSSSRWPGWSWPSHPTDQPTTRYWFPTAPSPSPANVTTSASKSVETLYPPVPATYDSLPPYVVRDTRAAGASNGVWIDPSVPSDAPDPGESLVLVPIDDEPNDSLVLVPIDAAATRGLSTKMPRGREAPEGDAGPVTQIPARPVPSYIPSDDGMGYGPSAY